MRVVGTVVLAATLRSVHSGSDGYVAGGDGNVASFYGFVGGGLYNSATGSWSNIVGGYGGRSSGIFSSIAGGLLNTATGAWSLVGGGYANLASGFASAIHGGFQNTVGDEYVASFAALTTR